MAQPGRSDIRPAQPSTDGLRGFQPRMWLPALRREATKANAYLVPLRWFLGVAWLRSAADKLLDPAWHSGDVLREFLATTGLRGASSFPELATLIEEVIEPSAPLVAGVVLALQLLFGAGILLGCFTNLALLGGITVNVAFMLAGAPNPSAFYVLIQIVLFTSNAGAIVGIDGWSGVRRRSILVAASPDSSVDQRDRWSLRALSALLMLLSGFAFTHGSDFSPAGSVTDPALVLGFISVMGALMVLLGSLRPSTSLVVDLTERLAAFDAAAELAGARRQ